MRALVLVLVLAATAGCRPEDTGAREHVITYEAVGEGGDAARLDGTVVLDRGCLLVRGDGLGPVLPSFPDDEVQWDGGRLVYAGEEYGDGDRIALGGGFTWTRGRIPAACAAYDDAPRWTVAQKG